MFAELGAIIVGLVLLPAGEPFPVLGSPHREIALAGCALATAVLLFLGSLPLFLGLPVVLPVLGHATWHLYRKVVDAERVPRAEIRPEPTEHRSAANFPVNLFPAKDEPPKQ